jgi:hypothetical protein
MLTHKGIISGITDNKEIICIQAPINKDEGQGGRILIINYSYQTVNN